MAPGAPAHALPLLLGRMTALALTYAAVARLGLAVETLGSLATLVWPPTGVALSALVVLGVRLWPGVAAGALIANLAAGAPAGVATGIAVGNTLEAVVGATILLRTAHFDRGLGTLSSVAALVLTALGSTVISATVGVATMLSGHVIGADQVGPAWLSWWLGDVIGALIVAPLLLNLSVSHSVGLRGGRLEALLLGALLVLTVALVFGQAGGAFATPLRRPFVVMPYLIWAAMRFGPRGAVLATFVSSAGAVLVTVVKGAALERAELHDRLLELQWFMAVAAVTFLVLGATVAERRRLLELEQAAHADALTALKARDDFLAIASHELRTPLTPLKLQLDGLIRAFDGDPRLKDRLRRAARQTDRLARLTEALLDVSRIAAGRLDLSPERFELGALLTDLLETQREDADRAGCTLTFEPPAQEVWVRWDRLRSMQAVSALISNAMRYGRGKPVALTIVETAGAVEISVQDHGVGIEPAAQTRIFERFERATAAKRYGGLGLGLYIVRAIARAHAGDVTVSSAPGAGSVFTLRLPRDVEDRSSAGDLPGSS